MLIRIKEASLDPDLDTYWEYGSGSGSELPDFHIKDQDLEPLL